MIITFFSAAFLGWLAGNIGSAAGIIAGAKDRREGEERNLVGLALFWLTMQMQIVKVPLALIIAGLAVAFVPVVPVLVSVLFCFALGYLFMRVVGQTQR